MVSAKRGSVRRRFQCGRTVLKVMAAGVVFTGCASSARSTSVTAPVNWRVVTYNIHHARGMDDTVSVERIARVLKALDADLVALQEVDERVARSGGEDQAARLGELLGMHHAFGSFMDYQGGRYGLAVLSRCTITASDTLRLTEGNEPRVALAVRVRTNDGDSLTFVNVHFDWVGDDGFRYAQASEVAQYLDHIGGDYILAGDFNDQPGSRTLELFHARAREATKPANGRFTFPSRAAAREIDFIFVSPRDQWEVRQVDVVAEPLASDHLPVVAEARTPAGRAHGGRRPAC